MCNKFDDVRTYILESKYDIVAISETWLDCDVPSDTYLLDGYNFYRNDRNGRGGGVAIYARRRIKVLQVICPNLHDGIDQLWLSMKHNKLLLTVGVVYRPPSVPCAQLECLYDVIPNLICKSDVFVCMGDFNINVLNKNRDCQFLCNILDSFNLHQIINDPTRVAQNSESLLDIIVINSKELILESGVLTCEPINTDHEAVYCILKCEKPKPNNSVVLSRSLREANSHQFQVDLQTIDWHSMYGLESINSKVDMFNDKILNIFDDHCPIRKTNIKKPRPPWLTYNLKKMIELKRKAFCKFKNLGTMESKNYYLQLKHYVNFAVRMEKKTYFTMEIEKCKGANKSKQLWKKMSNWKIVNKSPNSIPEHLNNPNLINNYFLDNIPPLNVDSTVISNNVLNLNNANNHPQFQFQFTLVAEEDILASLNSIKSGAIGIDGISISMLRLCLPFCLGPLTHIVNVSLESGTVPDLWKMALVTPIPKVNNPTSINELRPISILPTLSKILEKIVKSQIVSFLEQVNILPDLQSGFVSNRSCTTALLKVTSDITQAFDEGQVCPAVMVDLTKAFDSLDPDLLLAKLALYGIDAGGWFDSYLRNRQQAVKLMGGGEVTRSNWRPLERGVPQGSILGPLLFIIFSSDIIAQIKYSKYHIYADDLQIYLPSTASSLGNAINCINEDLISISDWAARNSLVINPRKTQAILYSRNYIDVTGLQITISGNAVEWVSEVKNLGLVMDSNLSFNSHVNNICQRSYYKLKSIYEYRSVLPLHVKKLLTETLVLTIPSYVDVVYGPFLTQHNKYRIQKVQNSCVRFVKGLSGRDHVSHHVRNVFKCNMAQRRYVRLSCIVHKTLIIDQPRYLADMVTLREHVHSVDLRSRNTIHIPRHRSEFFKSCYLYLAGYVYNTLPSSFKTLTYATFKRKVKDYVCDNLTNPRI